MKFYSIVKVGNEYVVQVNRQGVMKLNSRRQAVRLVAAATGMLREAEAADWASEPSIPCECSKAP
jgi:hypothetical protein